MSSIAMKTPHEFANEILNRFNAPPHQVIGTTFASILSEYYQINVSVFLNEKPFTRMNGPIIIVTTRKPKTGKLNSISFHLTTGPIGKDQHMHNLLILLWHIYQFVDNITSDGSADATNLPKGTLTGDAAFAFADAFCKCHNQRLAGSDWAERCYTLTVPVTRPKRVVSFC